AETVPAPYERLTFYELPSLQIESARRPQILRGMRHAALAQVLHLRALESRCLSILLFLSIQAGDDDERSRRATRGIGAGTSGIVAEDERKLVSILFADVKESMVLVASRDPEDARKLLDPIIELMMEATHYYGGTVNQVMGDGIMALFGAPIAHENHPVPAAC